MSTPRNCATVVLTASLLLATPTVAAPHADGDGNSGTRVVVTDSGPVRGIATPTMYAFLGIPYAAAPVSESRWRPPRPHARWHTPLDARQFGNACAQSPTLLGGGVPSAAEDCLFLNVFALPAQGNDDSKSRPVMVFIHGGGLTEGASNAYDPTKFVQEGVVVVTINYRLGILGFLTHPALTAESPDGASGNYGLMDQQFALRWVQNNIAHFGGDPNNVTIFGESAGGLSVHSNLVSPTAAGLFQKAISESGSYSLTQPTLAAAESLGTAFATLAGCGSQTAACLRALPVATVLAVQDVVLAHVNLVPTVDGKVLTLSLGAAFASGQFNRVPVIEGTNHDEYRASVATTELTAGTPLTATGYIPAIETTLGVSPTVATFLGTDVYPLAAYPPSSTAPSIALGALGTDAIFACNARLVSGLLVPYVPTYQYEFNDPNAPLPIGVSVSFPGGAYHASELQYLFDPAHLGFPGLSTEQAELSDAMVRYWTRFARNGDPNSEEGPYWPPYGPSDEFQSLEPPTPMTKATFALDHKCAFWGSF
jgi:para-nitrobenzyl esterase